MERHGHRDGPAGTGDTLDAREFGFGLLDISTLSQRRGWWKILERWNLPSDNRQDTVDRFAATGGELPMDLMMTTGQVRQLHASGMEIGAHTVNHPILTNLDPEEARREIGRSRHALEEAIGAPVTLFAYPNGRPGATTRRITCVSSRSPASTRPCPPPPAWQRPAAIAGSCPASLPGKKHPAGS